MQIPGASRIDYHVHTPYCGHAKGAIVDYVESAIAKGLREICFTDHLGRYYLTPPQRKRFWDWGMDRILLDRYWEELNQVKQIYGDSISIKIGLEIDYIEGADDLLEPLLGAYPFDFFLASVHCIPRFGWNHLADIHGVESYNVFRGYFDCLILACQSPWVDAIAHPDFIWRYTKWPRLRTVNVFEELSQVVQTALKHDCALEINANAWLWSQLYAVQGGDPLVHLVREIVRYQVPITIGSDAHEPRHVAKEFGQLIPFLKNLGVTHASRFDQHQRSSYSLE